MDNLPHFRPVHRVQVQSFLAEHINNLNIRAYGLKTDFNISSMQKSCFDTSDVYNSTFTALSNATSKSDSFRISSQSTLIELENGKNCCFTAKLKFFIHQLFKIKVGSFDKWLYFIHKCIVKNIYSNLNSKSVQFERNLK